jgi:uncharacterized protein YybS (DUF2232 family)
VPVYLAAKQRGKLFGALILGLIGLVLWATLNIYSLPALFAVTLLGYAAAWLPPGARPGLKVAALAAALFVLMAGAGTAVVLARPEVADRAAQEMLAATDNMLQQARLANTGSAQADERVDQFLAVAPYLVVGMIALWALWVAGLNYLITRYVMGRLGHEPDPLPPFARWRLPWPLAYGFIIGLGGVLFQEKLGAYQLLAYAAGLNLLLVCGALYLIQGLSIVRFYSAKHKLKPVSQGLLIMAALMLQGAFSGLSWLGLFDTWFDFRRLEKSRGHNT